MANRVQASLQFPLIEAKRSCRTKLALKVVTEQITDGGGHSGSRKSVQFPQQSCFVHAVPVHDTTVPNLMQVRSHVEEAHLNEVASAASGTDKLIPSGAKLGENYCQFALPIIQARLAQSAVRLAATLNQIFR